MHLDTHVLVWLFGGQRNRIPVTAQQEIEAHDLAISPIVELELAYLFEVGKVAIPPSEVLAELRPALGLATSPAPFDEVVRQAITLRWTRDPFDRLIAATALADGAALLTADKAMLTHLPSARWDGDV